MDKSEILGLWNVYLSETMTTHVTRYFINKTEDISLRKILIKAEELSKKGVEFSGRVFREAHHPLPEGFEPERDVTINAPRVYSDSLIILIKNKLIQDALVVSTMALASASRKDIRDFFAMQIREGTEMINLLQDLIQQRGLSRALHIPFSDQSEKARSSFLFLGGILEGHRPLSVAEIFNLHLNYEMTAVLAVFLKSFAQFTHEDRHVKEHFFRGYEIFNKQLQLFQNRLEESGMPQLPTWESELTDSKEAPFSERLMLFKTLLMLSATGGRYGVAVSTVSRKDIGTDFMRLMTEVLKYAEDTMNLFIKKGYFDQHPLAAIQEHSLMR